MAATTGFRTFYPALLPLGAAHIHGIHSAGPIYAPEQVLAAATSSSLLADYFVRASGLSNLYGPVFNSLPMCELNNSTAHMVEKYLQLNCLTSVYSSLWKEITGKEWTEDVSIRNAQERFHAQNDIDAIAALSLGITADELCMIYRTQFPVMRRYDQEDHFDAHGRKVPKEIMKLQEKIKEDGEQLPKEQRTWVHPQSKVTYTFEYPFASLDREADLRRAYAQFSSE